MILYKCKFCGAPMESPASMVGELETCPACNKMQAVPSNGDKESVTQKDTLKSHVRDHIKNDLLSGVNVSFPAVPDDVAYLVPAGYHLIAWYKLNLGDEEKGVWARLLIRKDSAKGPTCAYCKEMAMPVHDIMKDAHGANRINAAFAGLVPVDPASRSAMDEPLPSPECIKGFAMGTMICTACGRIVCSKCMYLWGAQLWEEKEKEKERQMLADPMSMSGSARLIPVVHCQDCLTPTLVSLTESRWLEKAGST